MVKALPAVWRLVQTVQSTRMLGTWNTSLIQPWRYTRHSLHVPTLSELVLFRTFRTSSCLQKKASDAAPDGPQIHVFSNTDEDLGAMSRGQAKRIAECKKLKLVEISCDIQTPVPVFKMMTGFELAEAQKQLRQLKRDAKGKSQKTLRVNSTISEHDLSTKTSHVVEWLTKGHEVKVLVKNVSRNDNDKGTSAVFQHLVDACKDLAAVKQAQRTPSELIFFFKLDNKDKMAEASVKPLKLQKKKQPD